MEVIRSKDNEKNRKLKEELREFNDMWNGVKGLTYNNRGDIDKEVPKNVYLILSNFKDFTDNVKFNELEQSIEIKKDLVIDEFVIRKGKFIDADYAVLRTYIQDKYGVNFSTNTLIDGINIYASKSENRYHPYKKRIEHALDVYDGQERIRTLLHDVLGAYKNETNERYMKSWLVAMVSKVYEPYFKYDNVLDLVGGQGTGKTTFLRKLSMGSYTDSIMSFDNKDDLLNMVDKLVVNDDEMTATRKSGFDELKRFITQESVEIRKPYARESIVYPKSFVIARTTNESTYLKDKTGDRRFLPVSVNVEEHTVNAWDMTEDFVDQIIGEAMSLYLDGYDPVITAEENKHNDIVRDDFKYVSEFEEDVLLYLDMPITNKWESMNMSQRYLYTQNYLRNGNADGELRSVVYTCDILNDVFNETTKNDKISKKIKYIMDNHKHFKYGRYRFNGINKRGYKRID